MKHQEPTEREKEANSRKMLLHLPSDFFETNVNTHTVFVIGISLFMTYLIVKILLPSYEKKLNSDIPPGSLGLPFIGETFQFLAANTSGKGVHDFVQQRRLRYGSCFKTKIFGRTHVFVSCAGAAKMILNNELGFTKRYIKSIAVLVGHHSILCASQEKHKLIRGHLGNLFSTTSMSRFIEEFDELVIKSLSSWGKRGTVVVLEEALKMILRAICRMLMSLESENEIKLLQKDVARVCEAMVAFPLRLPWTRFQRGLEARGRIMRLLDKLIQERRKGSCHEDFLQYLLTVKTCGEEHPSLTDAEIKDNLLTMIIAGQDTTASAITWMVKYLGENKRILDALRAEQLRVAKATARACLKLEDLSEMAYSSKVVKESLRMASIVPWFPRVALQDSEIEGYRIKKGWSVNIDAKSIHCDPSVHTDPNEFNPSRFDESKPYSFLAFGVGGRTCLGMNMAKDMMLVFLYRLVITYKWEVIDSDSAIEKWALFSRLRNGCPISLVPLLTS